MQQHLKKRIASVLFGLKETNHCFAYSFMYLKSWFKIPSMSIKFDDEEAIEVSSANKRMILERLSAMSFT